MTRGGFASETSHPRPGARPGCRAERRAQAPQARTGAGFSAILTRGIFRAIIGQLRRGGRVVDGARLESAYAATHRGFESHSLRQIYIPRIACAPSLT